MQAKQTHAALLTTAEAAKIIGCNPRTVLRWSKAKGIGQLSADRTLLTMDDVATLKSLVRQSPGNPNFVRAG